MITPRFIVLEGGDGAGKSTQFPLIMDAFKAANVPAVQAREPGGTHVGEMIRAVLKGDQRDERVRHFYKDVDLTAGQELILFSASRIHYLYEVVKPNLDAGNWFFSDRFAASTYAYQGVAGGLGTELVTQMTELTLSGFKPDLTLILDLPVEVGFARRHTDVSDGVRMENKGKNFHEKVRYGYRELAEMAPDEYALIDATADIATVHRAIIAELNARFGLALAPRL